MLSLQTPSPGRAHHLTLFRKIAKKEIVFFDLTEMNRKFPFAQASKIKNTDFLVHTDIFGPQQLS